MGYRAMRLRFLDLEPEEVFEHARQGDTRCADFVDLWQPRAWQRLRLPSFIWPDRGVFYLHRAQRGGFLSLPTLRAHLETMVKFTPLLSYSLEVLEPDDETALIGAWSECAACVDLVG